ncbi:MAG: hypothetical protein II062_03960 [Oscillospiraceae bacterium]|nr:hypothetical protein [Oscillospiraceae bacterium]
MASYLSDQERKIYEDAIAKAEPYSDEEMNVLDAYRDPLRVQATIARNILRMAAERENKK